MIEDGWKLNHKKPKQTPTKVMTAKDAVVAYEAAPMIRVST